MFLAHFLSEILEIQMVGYFCVGLMAQSRVLLRSPILLNCLFCRHFRKEITYIYVRFT